VVSAQYIVRYYPDTPITCYPFASHNVEPTWLGFAGMQDHIRNGGAKTMKVGTMDGKQYLALVESIKTEGIRNPVTIEYFQKEGLRCKKLCVMVGNNRATAMESLGMVSGPAVFVIPEALRRLLPSEPHADIDTVPGITKVLDELWDDGNWRSSNLLLEITREAEKCT